MLDVDLPLPAHLLILHFKAGPRFWLRWVIQWYLQYALQSSRHLKRKIRVRRYHTECQAQAASCRGFFRRKPPPQLIDLKISRIHSLGIGHRLGDNPTAIYRRCHEATPRCQGRRRLIVVFRRRGLFPLSRLLSSLRTSLRRGAMFLQLGWVVNERARVTCSTTYMDRPNIRNESAKQKCLLKSCDLAWLQIRSF